MSSVPAARTAGTGSGAVRYQRHRPEETLLYRIVEQHYPEFAAHLAGEGTALPGYVQREFDDYLQCGRLEYGFLRVRCDTCHAEHLVAFSCCAQLETMRSLVSRVRYSLDPPRDSLPLVSDR